MSEVDWGRRRAALSCNGPNGTIMQDQPAAPSPRYLRRSYLANGEELPAETRATKLYFFPGPVLALALILLLDYAAAAATTPGLLAVPALTPFFGGFSAAAGWSGAALAYRFLHALTLGALLLLGIRSWNGSAPCHGDVERDVVIPERRVRPRPGGNPDKSGAGRQRLPVVQCTGFWDLERYGSPRKAARRWGMRIG